MKLSTFIVRIAIFLLIPIAAASITYIYLKSAFLAAADPSNPATELIEIAPGKSFKDLCHDLEAKNLLKHWWSMSLLSRLGNIVYRSTLFDEHFSFEDITGEELV